MLIPARTDTSYFHEYIYHKAEIRFVRGRLHFNEAKQGAPFPSMVVIFDNREVYDPNGKRSISREVLRETILHKLSRTRE